MAAKKKEEDAETEAPPEGAEGEAAEGEGAPKKGKKKLIFIAAGVLVIVIVAVVVLLMGGKKEEGEGHGEPAAHEEGGHGGGGHGAPATSAVATPVYYELPAFLVNLNSATGKSTFLKMSVTLELRNQEAVAVVDANKPRIMDAFNTYLRELRPADIQGSAGIYRLRDELITRLNGTIEEGLVKDILFGEIIVQ